MTDKLIEALIKAQQEIDHVVQDEQNPFFKSDFASLRQVFDSVKKHLNNNGIYLQQVSHENEGGASIETIFFGHGSKVTSGKVSIPASKQDPQMFGSALSYAKRYSLLMACGIATRNEDDDAERAMKTHRVAAKNQGKYKLMHTDGKKVLKHTNDVSEYMNMCREFMPRPDEDASQKSYEANKWVIKSAFKDSREKIKTSYEQLIALYEKTGESDNDS